MPESRVVIRQNGIVRQLFKVDQASDKHLTITVSSVTAKLHDNPEALAEVKISIHNSEKAVPRGRTFHTTLKPIGSPASHGHHFVHLFDGVPFFAPAFIGSPGNFEFNDHKLKKETGKSILPLCAYDANNATLCYAVFIADRNYRPPRPSGFSLNIIKFAKYSVIIFSTFCNLATLPSTGLITGIVSRPVTKEGVPIHPLGEETFSFSMPESELELYIQNSVTKMMARAYFEADSSKRLAEFGKSFSEVQAAMSVMFSLYPFNQSNVDKRFGQNARVWKVGLDHTSDTTTIC